MDDEKEEIWRLTNELKMLHDNVVILNRIIRSHERDIGSISLQLLIITVFFMAFVTITWIRH
jgi:hypothetical protein